MNIIPGITEVPTFYFTKMALFDGGELKTLIFVARHTLGKGQQSTRISIQDFIQGYPELGQSGTRLAKGTQIKSIENLVKFGVLIEVAPNDPETGQGREWALQTDESQIDLNALWARHRNKKRTRAATDVIRRYPKIDFTPPSTGKAPGFVYLMKGVYGYKIGHSINPLKRAREIHNILLAWHPVEDREKSEKHLHELFSRVRVRGEYFDLSEDDLNTLYASLDGKWVKL